MADVRPRKPGGRRRPIPGEEYLTTREGSPHWHYDATIDGHRLRGSCGTADFAAACSFAAGLRDSEWRRLKLGEKPAVHMTIEAAFTRWYLDRGKGTVYGERGQKHQLARIIRILGGTTRLADLDNGTVARLVRGLRAGEGVNEGQEARGQASKATVNRYLATLQVVCAWARDVEGAVVGDWKKRDHTLKEPEPKDRSISKDTAREVLRCAVAHVRPAIMLDLLTGLRKGNLCGLTWEQVSLDLGRAVMIQKGDKPLAIELVPQAIKLLERLQPDPMQRTGPVFWYGNPAVACGCPHCTSPVYRGTQFRDPRRSIKTAFRKAGVPAMRIHDLRHTFASWLVSDSGDLKLTQEALGHANIETTMRYAHLMPGRKRAAIASATAALDDLPALPAPKKKDSAA